MIRKSFIAVGIFLLGSSPLVANTGYNCERTFLTTDGFNSRAAADSWFPEKSYIVYSDDNKCSASKYGISKKRAKVHREYGMSTFKRQGGHTTNIRHEDFDRKKNQLHISMTYPGYVEANPHKYKCGPAKETDFWPEEN